MTASYILRSYGGGAEPAQLTAPMQPTDMSFTIIPTTGWVQNNDSPLGTAGPFTVVIDRFTDTVEKITCTSVNLTTGVVTVSERGADGTTPQVHYPNGSPSGVQTCMTSVEAQEFNEAVAAVFGTSGSAPSTGYIFTWDELGAPAWEATAVSAVAHGGLWSTSSATIPQTTWTDIAMATGTTSGGMIQSGDYLIVPSAGKYLVCGQAEISVSTGATGFQAGLYSSVAATQRLVGSVATTATATDAANIGSTFAKVIECASGEELKLQCIQTSNPTGGWPLNYVAASQTNWLTCTFVSL